MQHAPETTNNQPTTDNLWRQIGVVLGINLGISFLLSLLAGIDDSSGFFVVLGITTWLVAIPVNFIALIVALIIKAKKGYLLGFTLAMIVVPLIGFATCSGFMPAINFH